MMDGRRRRVLIVDDSVVMRSLLRSVVSADRKLEVAGTAADGESALAAMESVAPDLILLDVEMPVMDGLATLRNMRARGYRMPVIVCSSLTHRGAKVTIEALACGASDYVAKPTGQPGREAAARVLAEQLLPRIHALTAPAASASSGLPRLPCISPLAMPHRPHSIGMAPQVVAIGVSTGGPAALEQILPALPADFPAPVLIVQHMPELFTRMLAERLNHRCRLRVREAAECDEVCAGAITIARGNWHMEVLAASCAGAPPSLHLQQSAPENHCRPAVDVLFRSAAAAYGSGVLALVLTGMGSDGVNGCRSIRERGGTVMIQDRTTSAVWGMPGAVANAGLAQKVLPLSAMAPEICRMVRCTRSTRCDVREAVS